MKALKILMVVSLVALAGCKQNPFPKEGFIVNEKPPEKPPLLPPIVIDVPDVIDFREGETTDVAIKAKVPAPATPIVTIADLPDGAVFDAATLKLSWTPGFDAGNEPNDPTVRYRQYVVTFTLRSSTDPVTSVTRRSTLTVHDVPRAVDVLIPNGDRPLTEGKQFIENIQVKSLDFPKGPFILNVTNLPQAAKLEAVQGDPTNWVLKYTPDLRTVTVEDNWSGSGLYKHLDVRYSVVLPSGIAVNKTSRWKIEDSRQFAAVSAPKNVVQGTDINFTVVAEDVNGEGIFVGGSTHPTIMLSNGAPEAEPEDPPGSHHDIGGPNAFNLVGRGFMALRARKFPRKPPPGFQPGPQAPEVVTPPNVPFGKLTLTIDKNDISKGNVNPVTIAAVRWSQIPADKIGTTQNMKFRICVNRYRWAKDHCAFTEVNVKFDAEVKPAPIIDRTLWPLAQLRYVRQNESFSVNLKVTDGQPGNPTPVVQIFPVAMRQEVEWKAGKLTINPKTAGVRQFNVVATSSFGVTQAESFLFEALPWSWSKWLILGESPSDAEVKKTSELFEDFALANPAFQTLDDKLLALRTSLIVGTKALLQRGTAPEIEKAGAKTPNVILLTPVLGNLEAGIKDELKDLKVELDKRFLDIAGAPDLKQWEIRLAPDAQLTNPSNAIKLTGKLTDESKSPLTLKLGAGSTCKPRLNLTNATVPDPLLVTVTCRRKNGGVLVVSGVEWGDFETSTPDAKIAKKWMSEVEKP